MTDHYKVLELRRDAAAEDVLRSYRTLALRHHPDRNTAPDAAAKMSAINEAWAVLGDPFRVANSGCRRASSRNAAVDL